jgi:hypothetical protein
MDDCLAQKADSPGRGTETPAMVTETVIILFDGKSGFGRKALGFHEI